MHNAIDQLSATISVGPIRTWMRLGFAVLGLLGLSAPALATVICVPYDASLTSAIQQANDGPEGSTWEIHVHTGTYQLNSQLVFLPDGDKDNKVFKMTGGWTGTNQCASQTTIDPLQTTIKNVASTPQAVGHGFIFLGDNARYEIESIRFQNFSSFVVDDGYCQPYHICPDTDAIILDHDAFDNGEILTIVAMDAHRVVFRNNLVTRMKPIYFNNGSTVDVAPVGFEINNEDPPQITFNTFANIDCLTTPGAVMVQSQQPQAALHHNVFQSSCANDLYIDTTYGGQPQTPYYNLFLTIGGAYQGNLNGNGNVINFNPLFVDAFNGDYHLQNASPAVNKGATLLGAIQSGFSPSPLDLDGTFRPIGTRYDIGAYESAVNDGAPPVITVNSSDDNDDGTCNAAHCSLREAINQANAQVGTAQRIVFNMPGTCTESNPIVIGLYSPLPDITDSVVIDGYSQPGWQKNDLDLGSDATICVLIGPFASVSHAFAVPIGADPSTTLTIQGLGFGNSLFYAFTTAAVDLRSGSGHKISGSAFGGYLPPGNNTQQAGSLGRAIYLSGTASNVTIGGPDNADRNYFGLMGATGVGQNGIVLNSAGNTGVTIQNNYIGVQPNGLGAQANATSAISISGGTDGTIVDNAICASNDGIELLGDDTTGFTIQRNNIGVNAAGYGVAAHANNAGIVIALGSHGHVIGAAPAENLQPGTYSNFIDNNNGDGIYIASNVSNNTVAGYNSIRGNLIEANGRSGTGVGIDLGGTQAQLANDDGDADTGANTLQNYPMIRGTTPNGFLTRQVAAVLNTAANKALRIDVYYAATCGGSKGANATTLVGSTDVNSGATGIVNIAATVVDTVTPGFFTMTATTDVGQTSELSPCVHTDTIFTDGVQKPGL